jgi:hypothetical protein
MMPVGLNAAVGLDAAVGLNVAAGQLGRRRRMPAA